jgi:hypothetical protein
MKHNRLLALILLTLAASGVAQTAAPTFTTGDYQIAGTVIDFISGQPIAGAAVQLAPVTDRAATRNVRTGPDGHFEFSGLTRGKYSLGASFRGYPAQGLDQHDAYSTAVAVGPALDATHIIFRLRPGASIHGRVVDEENEPVEGATVRLFLTGTVNGRVGTRIIRGASTDDQGAYAFTRLPEGTYYVAVNGRPWYSSYAGVRTLRLHQPDSSGGEPATDESTETPDDSADSTAQLDKTYPLTFYGGTTNSTDASPIDLRPGESVTTDINVRAVPNVHLRIPQDPQPPATDQPDSDLAIRGVSADRMRFMRAAPQVQVFQRLFNDTLVNIGAQFNGGSAQPEVTGFPAGRYLIQVSKMGENNVSGGYQELDVAGDMLLPTGALPVATVGGTVQFEGTPPARNFGLVMRNNETNRFLGTTLAGSGEFETKDALIPGRYEMAVFGAPGWFLKSVTASGAKLSGRTLVIAGGETVRLSLVVSQGLGEINGTAMRDGKPWGGAMIVLAPRNAANSESLFRRDQSDSDGTFTLRDVVPGQYMLVAIQDGWKLAWTDPNVLKRYAAHSENLQVAPSSKLQSTVTVQDR